MSTLLNSYPISDSDLSKRITQRLRQGKIDNQILEIIQQVIEKELEKENILLSRPEKVRLFHQSTKAILTDLLIKNDGDK